MSQFGHDHMIPQGECPACGYEINAAGGGKEKPRAGDLSVCMKCGEWLTFNKDLTVRSLTEEEIAELHDDNFQELMRVSKAVAEVRARK